MKNEREELREMLSRLPDAPVASNFTTRVMQAIESEELRRSRKWNFNWSWRAFLPRVALATVVIVSVTLTFREYQLNSQRTRLAKNVAFVVAAQPLPSVEALKNFDAIQRMSQTSKTRPDDELLALLQ